MSDTATQAVNLNRNIPTFLPLAEAVQKLGLSRKVLTRLIEAGKIEAVQLPSGEVLVSAETNGYEPKTKQEIIAKKFAHLQGELISVTEAAEAYEVPRNTILEWVKRNYIAAIKPGYRMELDEADVAYCAEIYKKKMKEYDGQLRGVNIFDEDGNPYELMHPNLSQKRRQKKR